MSEHYMKKACKHCPFRQDVKPFLTTERGIELAYHAQHPYNSFPCHKTTVDDEDSEDGEMMVTADSKECAGFITLQIAEGGFTPDGFEPDENAYQCVDDMIYAYEEQGF